MSNSEIKNISIIGSGNVAHHMSNAFRKAGLTIDCIISRNTIEGKKMARKSKSIFLKLTDQIPSNSDLYLICISDDAIGQVSKWLPKEILENKIIAHTSGSAPMSKIQNANRKAIFYPLQTFSKTKRMRYLNIPFCINASSKKDLSLLTNLADKISTNVVVINDDQRKRIHLAAVIINNFVNHLIYKSESFLERGDLDARILQPLLIETLKKQTSIGAFNAQTGPARRNDLETISSHLSLLDSDPELKELYNVLSNSIINSYKS